MRAFLPATLLLSSAFWTGNFQAPLWPEAVLFGHLLLIAVVVLLPGSWRDPLSLGNRARWLLLAATIWIVVGVLWSPVRRAGWLAMWLWPAFLMLPASVARCWDSPLRRRLGLQSVAVVMLSVGAVSLWFWVQGESARAALPLGHHNLLAIWLLTLLPLLFPLFLTWDKSILSLAGLVVGLSLVAIIASGSLAAMTAMGVLLLVFLIQVALTQEKRLSKKLVLLLCIAGISLLAVGISQSERFQALWAGNDSSLLARASIWQGAWQGSLERPWGWGVGASAWTLSRFVPPSPGVLPAGEVIADIHNLPLTILYETGWPGLLLAVSLLVILCHRLIHHPGPGKSRRRAGLFSLLGFGVASLGGVTLSVLAIPIALAIAVGSALPPPTRPRSFEERPSRWPHLCVGLLILCMIVPLDVAAIRYSQAIEQDAIAEQRSAVQAALDLDATFPLYTAQLSLLDEMLAAETNETLSSEVRARSWKATQGAPSVGPLWLLAGISGQDGGEPWSRDALLQTCAVDPLSAMAPFLLAVGEPLEDQSVEWAARALLAEPRLLAALEWRQRPETLSKAVDLLADHPDIDAGWRQRLVDSYDRLLHESSEELIDVRQLALSMDSEASTSMSLHAFRRPPWPTVLVAVEVDGSVLRWLDLVSLSGLRETDPRLFSDGCSLG